MKFNEHALSFRCGDTELRGIVAVPEQLRTTGALIVVGSPPCRVGSRRQFLLLARVMARTGLPAMRFDYRAMRDSPGEQHDFTALDAFRLRRPKGQRIVHRGRSEVIPTHAHIRHCYGQCRFAADFWRKLPNGNFAMGRVIVGIVTSLKWYRAELHTIPQHSCGDS